MWKVASVPTVPVQLQVQFTYTPMIFTAIKGRVS